MFELSSMLMTIEIPPQEYMEKYLTLPGAFRTGSSLIKDDPGDYDIVVPYSTWEKNEDVFCELTEHTTLYSGDNDDPTLWTTYRDGLINLLIVLDEYIPKWQAVTAELQQKPHRYLLKEDRVKMFESIKREL